MKKVLLSLFFASLGYSSLNASSNGSLFSYQIGYSANTTETTATQEPETGGFYNGVDLMRTSDNGVGYGIGFDVNVWNPKRYDGISEGTSFYSMGLSAKVGYTFQNRYDIPLKLKAGIGYGVIDVTTHDGWGMQYETGVEYLLFKTIGIGVKHK
ncbi:MAG: hypothetical protein AB7S65_11290 [Sulfuricurvum sp.]